MPAFRIKLTVDFIEADESEARDAVVGLLYDLDAHNNTLALEVEDIEQLDDGN